MKVMRQVDEAWINDTYEADVDVLNVTPPICVYTTVCVCLSVCLGNYGDLAEMRFDLSLLTHAPS